MESADGLEFGDSDGAVTVYSDRIEAREKKRSRSIAFSEIADVQVARRPKRLVIVTREGKQLQYNLGNEAEAARSTIARRLASG